MDALLVDIEPPGPDGGLPRAWAAWTSTVPSAIRDWNPEDKDFIADTEAAPGFWRGRIGVPEFSRELLGANAGIRLTVTPRTVSA
jgi:hypothetical protein